ncbi:MAG: hydrogenase maturation peptidase HycI [Candidatus Omnitrophica bacterium]|nr:hydrogenase maturation peptidase HycI [Candidatus Omnitrophota bacterium]
MASLKIALGNWLRDAKRIALLGIGSELRGDDVAGILVASELRKNCRKISGGRRFKVFLGATAPENLTGEIKKFKPTHLVIIDSADTGKKAGEIALINPEQANGITFCTHRLPLKIMVDYLIEAIGCEVLIVGIKPKTLDFGSLPSKEVKKAIKIISGTIKEIINNSIRKEK